MPIYKVITTIPEKITAGEAVRLVKADNRAQALKYAAESTITVGRPTQEDLVVLVASGVKVEHFSTGEPAQLGQLNR